MSFVNTRFTPATDDALVELNAVLSERVFIVNTRLTLADLCLYAALSDAVVRCWLTAMLACIRAQTEWQKSART